MELLLKTIKQYITVLPQEEEVIARLFTETWLKAGDYFLRQGQTCRYVAFIASGLLRYFLDHEGLEKTLFFSKEQDFVSDYQSFLPRIPSAKNIQALEDTHLLLISRENLERFYREVAQGERFGRLAIEHVFLGVMQQLDSLYVDTAAMRYQRFLDTYSSIAQRIPQFYIASYVGVRAPSLSRIRRRFINPG